MKIRNLFKNKIPIGVLAIVLAIAARSPVGAMGEDDALSEPTPAMTQEDDHEAPMLEAEFEIPEGADDSGLEDGDYGSAMLLETGSSFKIKTSAAMSGLYIVWDAATPPGTWILRCNGEETVCGTDGFLHEYVPLPEGVTECELSFRRPVGVCEIYAYGEGDLPENVQTWEKIKKDADIMIFVPHAGDEILDYGALTAFYAARKDLFIQIVYMCEYRTTEEILKEHEKLDSLWSLGVKYYPISGDFRNKRLTDVKTADKFYGYEKVLRFVTENIRKYRPLVVVGPDIAGEYGNGAHVLLSDAVRESVQNTQDPVFFEESVAEYGTWDVPKTYIHKLRYKTEGSIDIDFKNGIGEIVKEAFNNRLTDTWCGTYIDSAKYNLEDSGCFGLFRTTVGTDTKGDVTENLMPYGEQAKKAAEEAERQRREEFERQKALYEEQLRKASKVGDVLFGKYIFGGLREQLKKINASEWE